MKLLFIVNMNTQFQNILLVENILFSYSEVFFTPLFWETPNFIFINGGAPIFRTMYVGRKNE